jgi:predicted RNase H-like nuclease (RuvC/YqgF family)
MLLNEFLKEHRKVEALESTVAHIKSAETQQKDLQATVAQQQQQIERLTRTLKEQSAQIQKVSDQLEADRATQQLVANN